MLGVDHILFSPEVLVDPHVRCLLGHLLHSSTKLSSQRNRLASTYVFRGDLGVPELVTLLQFLLLSQLPYSIPDLRELNGGVNLADGDVELRLVVSDC